MSTFEMFVACGVGILAFIAAFINIISKDIDRIDQKLGALNEATEETNQTLQAILTQLEKRS